MDNFLGLLQPYILKRCIRNTVDVFSKVSKMIILQYISPNCRGKAKLLNVF